MNILLERSELAILVLHMNIMRKTIKKGFKAKYGHFETSRQISTYDELKGRLKNELNGEIDPISFDCNEKELNMLHSFISWYVPELKQAAGSTNEQIMILESIYQKANALAEGILNI